eukprot:141770-Hanusia_phi.AAC.1
MLASLLLCFAAVDSFSLHTAPDLTVWTSGGVLRACSKVSVAGAALPRTSCMRYVMSGGHHDRRRKEARKLKIVRERPDSGYISCQLASWPPGVHRLRQPAADPVGHRVGARDIWDRQQVLSQTGTSSGATGIGLLT